MLKTKVQFETLEDILDHLGGIPLPQILRQSVAGDGNSEGCHMDSGS